MAGDELHWGDEIHWLSSRGIDLGINYLVLFYLNNATYHL